MRLLFIHNDRVKEDEDGNLYTGGSYNQSVWDRYLKLSSELTVLLKKDRRIYPKEEAVKRFNKFDQQKIKFVALDDLYHSMSDFFSPAKRRNIVTKVKEEVLAADAVIVRSVASLACRKAIQFSSQYRKPYMIEVTGIAWRSLWHHDFRGKLLAPFVEICNKYYISQAPYVLYVTQETLQKCYPGKGVSIGVSDVEIPAINKQTLTKRISKINNGPDKIIIGTIGNVDLKNKNQRIVIKAIQILNRKGYQFEYQMVGYGDKENLQKYAKCCGIDQCVKFLGALTHEKVFEWLQEIDVYIQPSRQEGLPRALVEAASTACPVLGSRVGGIPELVSPNYLFYPGNVKEVVRCLETMSQKEEMVKEAARSYHIAERYQKEVLDEKREQFYRKFKTENHLK